MAQEYLDSTDNMKLQEMSRLRQESKLLDMDIIVSWMAIPLNRPFNFRPRGTTAFPRIVWCCALVFHNWKIKLWHNETANLIGLDFLRRRFYHFSLIFFSIVEAVVNFAYTGKILICRYNVCQLYLLAFNLKCQNLIAYCISFIQERQVTLVFF